MARRPDDDQAAIQNACESLREQVGLVAMTLPQTIAEQGQPLFSALVDVLGTRNWHLITPGGIAQLTAEVNSEPPLPEIETPEIVVTRSTRFTEEYGGLRRLYRTRGLNRGLFVLFSYYEFQSNLETYRTGAAYDCELLKWLFGELGIKPLIFRNKSKQETEALLSQVARERYECVFVMVSSHGYGRAGSWDTTFRCSDGGFLSVHEVVDRFHNQAAPGLVGIPKVFIFQMCRGKKIFPRLTGAAHDPGQSAAAAAAPRRAAPAGVRLYSDMLIAYSTVPGYTSPRIGLEEEGNTWYVRALCEVFAAHAHDTPVRDLFPLVDGAMCARGYPQTCPVEDLGFHRLFLHPGLVEAPAPRPVEASAPRPVEAPAPRPVEASAPRPVEAPAPRPVEAPVPRPVEASAPRPVEAPAPRPVEAPAPRPVEV